MGNRCVMDDRQLTHHMSFNHHTINKLQNNYQKIIALQALIRGYLVRKQFLVRLFVKKRENYTRQLLAIYADKAPSFSLAGAAGDFSFDSPSFGNILKNRQQQLQIKKHLKETRFGRWGDYVGEYNPETLCREGVGVQWDQHTLYIGHFLKNRRHGKGRVLAHSHFFQGYFSGDVPQGQGLFQQGDLRVQGNFSGGVLEGSDIREDNLATGEHYTGQFVAGKRQGKGLYRWPQQECVYQGDFKQNMVSGQGVATWSTPSQTTSYTGGFINNRMHFHGHYQTLDSHGHPLLSFNGEYYNGLRHGHGVYQDTTQRIHAYFQNGKVFQRQYSIHLL